MGDPLNQPLLSLEGRRSTENLPALAEAISAIPDGQEDPEYLDIPLETRDAIPTNPFGPAVPKGSTETYRFSSDDILDDLNHKASTLVLEAERQGLLSEEQANEFLGRFGYGREGVLSEEEVDKEKRRMKMAARSPRATADLAEGASRGGVTFTDVGFFNATRDRWKDEDGFWNWTFWAAGAPGQALARQTTNVLENLGALTTTQAKDILSQKDVYMHDLVDYFWGEPESWYGTAGRFTTGLAADILTDPLNLIGLGAPAAILRTVNIGGKAINVGKLSGRQARVLKIIEEAGFLIENSAGEIAQTKRFGKKAIEHNQRVEENFAVIAEKHPELISLEAFTKSIRVPKSVQKGIEEIRLKGSLPDRGMVDWFGELARGERKITVGPRLPFTNLGTEYTVFGRTFPLEAPGIISETIGKGGETLMKGLGIPFDLMEKSGSPQLKAAAGHLKSFWNSTWTKTGASEFDSQLVRYYGNLNYKDQLLKNFGKRYYDAMENIRENVSDDEYLKIQDMLIAEAERGMSSQEFKALTENFSVLDDFGLDEYGRQLLSLIIPRRGVDKVNDAAAMRRPQYYQTQWHDTDLILRAMKTAEGEFGNQESLLEFIQILQGLKKAHESGQSLVEILRFFDKHGVFHGRQMENMAELLVEFFNINDIKRPTPGADQILGLKYIFDAVSDPKNFTVKSAKAADDVPKNLFSIDGERIAEKAEGVADFSAARESARENANLREKLFGRGERTFTVKPRKGKPIKVGWRKLSDIMYGSKEDLERIEYLRTKYDDLANLVDEMAEQNLALLGEYKKRGIPMDELNIFTSHNVRRYIKHALTEDWFDYVKATTRGDQELVTALEYITKTKPSLVSGSELGRSYRGSIRDANSIEDLEKMGLKMFVDDPLVLHTMRSREMQKMIELHDTFQSAWKHAFVGRSPRPDYIKFNVDDFSKLMLKDENNVLQKFKPFIPKQFFSKQGVYLPQAVYDRLLFMVEGHTGVTGTSLWLLDKVGNSWKNNALMGLGYLGQNLMTNLTTLTMHTGPSGITSLFDATKVLTRAFTGKFGKTAIKIGGDVVQVSDEMLLEWAVRDGILKSGFNKEMDFYSLAESMSTSMRSTRNIKFGQVELPFSGKGVQNAADIAFGWRINRLLAQWGDDMPKFTMYIDRLKKGFTREAAAEAAETHFYNFTPGGRAQDFVRRTVPFSSFPLKTTERILSIIKSGNLSSLQIPAHVYNGLMGAYVESRDTQDFLRKEAPAYMKNTFDPIVGHLLPGQNLIKMNLPFATMSVTMLTAPAKHPIIPMLEIAAYKLGGLTDQELADAGSDNTVKFKLGQTLDAFMPPTVKIPMAIAEMNGWIDHGGFWIQKYAPDVPSKDDMTKQYRDGTLLVGSPRYQRFMNEAEFGDYVYKNLGEGFIFRNLFPDISNMDPSNENTLRLKGTVGGFVRSQFRNFALGSATMTKLDKNFFVNNVVLGREIDKKTKALKQQINNMHSLYAPATVGNTKMLKELAEKHPEAKELLILYKQREALAQMYEWLTLTPKKYPKFDYKELFFSPGEFILKGEPSPLPEINREAIGEGVNDAEAEMMLNEMIFKEKPDMEMISPGPVYREQIPGGEQ